MQLQQRLIALASVMALACIQQTTNGIELLISPGSGGQYITDPDFKPFGTVELKINGFSATAIGDDFLISAGHAFSSPGGATVTDASGTTVGTVSDYRLTSPLAGSGIDLVVFKVSRSGGATFNYVDIWDPDAFVLAPQPYVIGSYGPQSTSGTPTGTLNWGTRLITDRISSLLLSSGDSLNTGVAGVNGDSGSGWFVKDGLQWKVAGYSTAIFASPLDGASARAFYGDIASRISDMGGTLVAPVFTTPTATTTWTGAVDFDWDTAGNWDNGVPSSTSTTWLNQGASSIVSTSTSTRFLYIGTDGVGTLTITNGGTLAVGQAIALGVEAGSSGTLNHSGGHVSSPAVFVGYDGVGNLVQTGTATLSATGDIEIGRNSGSTGHYNLKGGTANVGGRILIGRNTGSTGTLTLSFISSTATLTAGEEHIVNGRIVHYKGINNVGYLGVGTAGMYQMLGGGALNVTSSGAVDGTLSFNSSTGSLTAAGIFNLSNGTLTGTSSATVHVASNSLAIFPSGFNPNVAFGSLNNQGIVHVAGGSLTIPASSGFAGRGRIDDRLNVGTSAVIVADSGYGIDVNAGISVASLATVDLGTGRVTTSDSTSGVSGGDLTAYGLTVDGGTFTLSNGVIGTTGGGVILDGASANFVQSGGTLAASTNGLTLDAGVFHLSGGVVASRLFVNGAQARVIQTGGGVASPQFMRIGGGQSLSNGYELQGGSVTTGSVFILSNAAFAQSGGTLLPSGTLLIEGGSQFGLSGGTLTIGNQLQNGGTFTQSGGVASSPSVNNGTMSGGTLIVGNGTFTAGHVRQDAITITQGGVVKINSSGTNSGLSMTKALSISGSTPQGKFDLTDNDLIIDYSGSSPIATVRSYLQAGYNSGSWDGTGLTSSLGGQSFSLGITALGFGEASTLGLSTFTGQTVDSDSVLIKYTFYGDMNLDGDVDNSDYMAFLPNLGMGSGAYWTDGDFDYDGDVDNSDYGKILAGYGAVGLAPEPCSIVVFGFTVPLFLRTRKQRP